MVGLPAGKETRDPAPGGAPCHGAAFGLPLLRPLFLRAVCRGTLAPCGLAARREHRPRSTQGAALLRGAAGRHYFALVQQGNGYRPCLRLQQGQTHRARNCLLCRQPRASLIAGTAGRRARAERSYDRDAPFSRSRCKTTVRNRGSAVVRDDTVDAPREGSQLWWPPSRMLGATWPARPGRPARPRRGRTCCGPGRPRS